jgi:PhnB protein
MTGNNVHNYLEPDLNTVISLISEQKSLCSCFYLKFDNMAKVSTYLNFPGNTREVFEFYKSVFGGEFAGGGIMRFGDIPATAETPPVLEEAKNLVMHVELPILGGHILMGTDAPKSMGFSVNRGNNVYISLETDTKEEADRLFAALSEGGKVTMELKDTFWGAYYGNCTDKFGIQWMVNYTYVKP